MNQLKKMADIGRPYVAGQTQQQLLDWVAALEIRHADAKLRVANMYNDLEALRRRLEALYEAGLEREADKVYVELSR